jgi:hypothetical protein
VKVENVASLYLEPFYGKLSEVVFDEKNQCLGINLQRSMVFATKVFPQRC